MTGWFTFSLSPFSALNNVVLSPSIPLKIISGFNSTKNFVVTFKNAQLQLVSFVACIKAKSQSLASNELHVRNNDPELSIVNEDFSKRDICDNEY